MNDGGFDIWRELELIGARNPEADAMQEAIFLAIGKITAYWSAIYLGLDTLVSVIAVCLDGPALDELPRSLRQKTRFLRTAFNTVRLLQPFAAEGKAVLARINTLKQKRHRVAHGMVLQTAFDHPGYRLMYPELHGRKCLIKQQPIAKSELDRAASASERLTRDVMALSARIVALALQQGTQDQ